MTASFKQAVSQLPSPHELLDLLPSAVMVVAGEAVLYANKTANELGLKRLEKELIELCNHNKRISIHDHMLRIGSQQLIANIHIQPMEDGMTMLVVHPHSAVLQHQHASSWKQEITRAAGVMAAMLAHEVKNPLSGIRGAAQLLAQNVSDAERPLTDLIVNESLRIRDLLDQVEIFSDERTHELAPLNIHEVLQYTIQVARAGFASHVTFIERYDPSLPEALSHHDALVQVFLNIIKNASEALLGVENATITLTTSYQSGVKYSDKKLPITVTIADNGRGIPADVRAKLFEPFVSTKEKGRGLGLAVVAKLASDVGVMVECDDKCAGAGASFTIRLPCA